MRLLPLDAGAYVGYTVPAQPLAQSADVKVTLDVQDGYVMLVSNPSGCWSAHMDTYKVTAEPVTLEAGSATLPLNDGATGATYVCYRPKEPSDAQWMPYRRLGVLDTWFIPQANSADMSWEVVSSPSPPKAGSPFTMNLFNVPADATIKLSIDPMGGCEAGAQDSQEFSAGNQPLSVTFPDSFGGVIVVCMKPTGGSFSPLSAATTGAPNFVLRGDYSPQPHLRYSISPTAEVTPSQKATLSLFGSAGVESEIGLSAKDATCAGVTQWYPTHVAGSLAPSITVDVPAASKVWVCYRKTAGRERFVEPVDSSPVPWFAPTQGSTVAYTVVATSSVRADQEFNLAFTDTGKGELMFALVATPSCGGDKLAIESKALPGSTVMTTTNLQSASPPGITIRKYSGAAYVCISTDGGASFSLAERRVSRSAHTRAFLILASDAQPPYFSVKPTGGSARLRAYENFTVELYGAAVSTTGRIMLSDSPRCSSGVPFAGTSEQPAVSPLVFTPLASGVATMCYRPSMTEAWISMTPSDGNEDSTMQIGTSMSYSLPIHPSSRRNLDVTIHEPPPGTIELVLSRTSCSSGPEALKCFDVVKGEPGTCTSTHANGELQEGTLVRFFPTEEAMAARLCALVEGAQKYSELPVAGGVGQMTSFELPSLVVDPTYDVVLYEGGVNESASGAVEGLPFGIYLDTSCFGNSSIVSLGVTPDEDGCATKPPRWAVGGTARPPKDNTATFTVTELSPTGSTLPHFVCISTDGGTSWQKVDRIGGGNDFSIESPGDGPPVINNTVYGSADLFNVTVNEEGGGFEYWWIFLVLAICCCLALLLLGRKYKQTEREINDLRNNFQFDEFGLDQRLLDPDYVGEGKEVDQAELEMRSKQNKENPMENIDDLL